MISSIDSPVIQDLLGALNDQEMTDITLVGQDGVSVYANRFVLAARSKVLKRMLYGNFRESRDSEISFHDYDAVILEALVEYCCRDEIPKFRLYVHRDVASVRRLVQLYKAADYLELPGLAKLVSQMVHNLMARYPPLACAIYDEADLDSTVSKGAILMIQCRPYATLPRHTLTGGGIECLSGFKLLEVYKDTQVSAGELFLFQMLQEWENLSENPNAKEIVCSCAEHLYLENIEPQDLLGVVMKSGYCSEKTIMDAITKQALRASQHRVWSLSSRGRQDLERILVEGAGSQNANGIYYRIDGLANGELYTKREVVCGHQYVYSMSISVNKDKQVESRLFCSKLLTHNAIKTIVRNPNRDLALRPLLQVIEIEAECKEDERGATTKASAKKVTRMKLSDGEHSISATIANPRGSSDHNREISQNTLLKVCEYTTYFSNGRVTLQLNKVSIVSQDPGQKFGNPSFYYDVLGDQDEEDDQPIVSSDTPIETQICHDLMQRQDVASESNQTLVELYSCFYDLKDKPIDSKIKSRGWKIDSHGTAPSPRCRWIPAKAKARESRSSQGSISVTALSCPVRSN